MPALSIVICTVGRERQAGECIASLLRQDGDYEIVVIDQNPVPGAYPADAKLRVVRTASRGLAAARNCGLARSSGPIVAFIDDDAVADEGYVTALGEIFRETAIDGAGGKILIRGTDMPYARSQRGPDRLLGRSSWDCMLGGNMAFRKSALHSVGGFDDRFGAGAQWPSGEEADLFLRMQYRSLKIVYRSAFAVHHPLEKEGHTDASLRKKLYEYGRGRGALHMKHMIDRRDLRALLSLAAALTKPLLRMAQFIITMRGSFVRLHAAVLAGRCRGAIEYAARGCRVQA